MGSRFKDRGLGAIKVDERGGAEAGAAGGVGCFDVGNFCEIAGCRSAGSSGVISSEATGGEEASACLRAFCCGTFSCGYCRLSCRQLFESPFCEGGLMGSRFKDRELGAIEADERGDAKAGAAGGVGCFDVGNSAKAQGVDPPAPTASSHQKRRERRIIPRELNYQPLKTMIPGRK